MASLSMTKGGMLIHTSFGIPVGSKTVAGSGHVIRTLPAVGCLVRGGTGIVLFSRLKGMGTRRSGTGLDLGPMTSHLTRLLNGRIAFIPRAHKRTLRATVTTLGSKSILMFRGAHFRSISNGGRDGGSTRLNGC